MRGLGFGVCGNAAGYVSIAAFANAGDVVDLDLAITTSLAVIDVAIDVPTDVSADECEACDDTCDVAEL